MTAKSILLKHFNIPKEKKDQFIKEYIMFIVTIVAKLQENNPLKFHLVRFSSRTSPKNLLHNPETSLFKFEDIVDKLFSDKRMSSSETELSRNMNHF